MIDTKNREYGSGPIREREEHGVRVSAGRKLSSMVSVGWCEGEKNTYCHPRCFEAQVPITGVMMASMGRPVLVMALVARRWARSRVRNWFCSALESAFRSGSSMIQITYLLVTRLPVLVYREMLRRVGEDGVAAERLPAETARGLNVNLKSQNVH